MVSALVDRVSFDELESFIEELATTEGRLVSSVVVVLLLGVLATVILPWLIRVMSRTVRNRLLTDGTKSIVDDFNAYIPTTITDILIRTIQVALLFVGIVSLLIIWNLDDMAVMAVRVVGISIPLLAQIAVTFFVFILAYIAVQILEDAVNQYSERADRITQHEQEIILRIGHLSILTVALMGALSLWGLDLTGIVVGAGFLGIVLGLAARQTLGSMIAGFVLMFSRPFTIGDWVEIGDDEGIVTQITIMQTYMQNFDGELIAIPNDLVANEPITNRTNQGILRTRIDVGVDYEADIEHAQSVALEAIESVEDLATSPRPNVTPTSFGDSAVVLELRFWIENPDPPSRRRATEAVIFAIKRRFDEEGIKIPYPQRELSGREETDGFRIRNGSVSKSPRQENATDAKKTDGQ